MKTGIIGEGPTDFIVIQYLLLGFFNDKNLPVTRLFPENTSKPAGWGNVLEFLKTERFKKSFDNLDLVIIQIDSQECGEWGYNLNSVVGNDNKVEKLIENIIKALVDVMGQDTYELNKDKLIFAITVNEIECWLLPFHINQAKEIEKIVGCYNLLKKEAKKKYAIDINHKNYNSGQHYKELSRPLLNKVELMKKYSLNPSLRIFVEVLLRKFPRPPEVQF